MFDLNKVYSAENGTDIFFKYIKPPSRRKMSARGTFICRSRRAFLKHRHQGHASADAENSDCVSAVCFLFKPHIFVGEEVEFSCDSGRSLFCTANVFAEMPQNPSPKYPKILRRNTPKSFVEIPQMSSPPIDFFKKKGYNTFERC